MSLTVTPEVRTVTCDRCGLVCTPDNRKLGATAAMHYAAVDSKGVVTGTAAVDYDLCDKCFVEAKPLIMNIFPKKK